jgi:hypothetical protein
VAIPVGVSVGKSLLNSKTNTKKRFKTIKALTKRMLMMDTTVKSHQRTLSEQEPQSQKTTHTNQ